MNANGRLPSPWFMVRIFSNFKDFIPVQECRSLAQLVYIYHLMSPDRRLYWRLLLLVGKKFYSRDASAAHIDIRLLGRVKRLP
jgi:hypothetical protein